MCRPLRQADVAFACIHPEAMLSPTLPLRTLQGRHSGAGAGSLAGILTKFASLIPTSKPTPILCCRGATRELGLEALAGILACTYSFDEVYGK